MKASVQYDDYVGTCAADISDYVILIDVLKQWGVSTERFFPIGVKFYCGETDTCYLSILCNDKESGEGRIAEINYIREPGYSISDVMQLFKHFQVILTTEGMQDCKIEDESVIYVE